MQQASRGLILLALCVNSHTLSKAGMAGLDHPQGSVPAQTSAPWELRRGWRWWRRLTVAPGALTSQESI